MTTPKQQYYENLAESLIEAFNRRGIEGYYCADKADALTTALRFLTPGCSVSWGGSVSCTEIGLFEALKNSDFVLHDRAVAKTPEEQRELYAKAVMSDYYFMSSNAVTLDGQLINIDGNGNRVACLAFGPETVIVMVGMNKIVDSVDSGIARVQNVASPANAARLGTRTPCGTLGHCGDCHSEDCMCCQIVITRHSRTAGRIKVILIGEELGY